MKKESISYYPESKFLDIESIFPQHMTEENLEELSTLHNCGWLSPQELINYDIKDISL